MDKKNKLQVYPTSAALSDAAAELIRDIAIEAVQQRGKFAISLSGGNTPGQLYTRLSKPPFSDQTPWAQTFIFWGDERCVPADDERNNSRMTRLLLLDKVNIPPGNIYPVPVDLPPAKGATAYQNTVTDFFHNEPPRFDLVLLGLGENGHTASLFPGTEVLQEKEALVKEVYVEEQKMFRVTMTVPLINLGRNIIFLVSGSGKAAILQKVLSGPYQPTMYPAQLIKPVDGEVFWMVDEAAAS